MRREISIAMIKHRDKSYIVCSYDLVAINDKKVLAEIAKYNNVSAVSLDTGGNDTCIILNPTEGFLSDMKKIATTICIRNDYNPYYIGLYDRYFISSWNRYFMFYNSMAEKVREKAVL